MPSSRFFLLWWKILARSFPAAFRNKAKYQQEYNEHELREITPTRIGLVLFIACIIAGVWILRPIEMLIGGWLLIGAVFAITNLQPPDDTRFIYFFGSLYVPSIVAGLIVGSFANAAYFWLGFA